MRPDLAKCTTERPRSGGSLASCYKLKFGGKVRIHPDTEHDYSNEFGGFKSSARHRHYESKSFTDALGALRGNIRKNVGRPWDKVYSEFCQLLDRRSVSGYHIWTHLMWEVELNTYMHDGVVRDRRNDGPVDGYYVHPVTGILEFKEPYSWKRNFRKLKHDVVPVPDSPGWHYRQVDGLWFRLREEYVPYKCYWDMMTGKTKITEECWNIAEKKSANRKEIAWVKAQLGV